MKYLRIFFNKQKWAYGLFWSWNVIFLAFMFLGFAPNVLAEMITAVRAGDIPANFLLYAAILTLIPAVVVVLGFTILRREPTRLFALGYGVEGPIMLLLAIRFFVVRQMTTAVALLLLTAGLGILTYFWQLLDRNIGKRNAILTHLRLVGLTLLLITGIYTAIWIGFYALPAGVEGISSAGDFVSDIWRELTTLDWASIQWRLVPFTVLGITLFIFSGTLFVLMPIAVFYLYGKAWLEGIKDMAAAYSKPRAIALSTAVILLIVLLSIPANRQPQHKAFALMAETPTSPAEADALLAEEEAIREGLLNAYLAPQRYISAQGEVRHISEIYEYTLHMAPKNARQVQAAYETIAGPILYQPVEPIPAKEWSWQNQALQNEPQKAADLYEQYFDEPITDGEHDTIVRAARSTWSIDQARANWQAVDDREIWLANQEVTIIEHGDWAEFELVEVYQNQTAQRQEVVYYFSLPETAVLTGIWLGNSDNRDERFTYHVAPRGAAQATYRNEVRRNIDPALLEQIGPGQYRLRAFPVEPMRWEWDADRNRSTLQDGPPLHLWVTWQVMADGDSWPMPHLAEKLNVYWTDETTRLLNGEPMDADHETWLPPMLPVSNPTPPAAHRVDFGNGLSVVAEPVISTELPQPAGDLKLAVVLDRSRSMQKLAVEVETALSKLAAWGNVDVYLTASDIRGEAPTRTTLGSLDTAHILYFGGQSPAQLLAQFGALHKGEAYDAIFVLTDGTGYELGEPAASVPVPDAPVWMVHLNGRFPIGYDDETLAALQASGGGSVGSITDGLTRLLASQANETADMVDGYKWSVVETETAVFPTNAIEHNPADTFAAFAARRIILAEMAANRGTLDNLETLDALHELAIENSIVTPYSSMIVLVTSRQERLLQELSEQDDRFDREFEDVGETTLDPVPITGVPEPEEWLLIGLGVIMLIGYLRQNRQKMVPQRLA